LSEQLAALNLASNAVTNAETDQDSAVDARDDALDARNDALGAHDVAEKARNDALDALGVAQKVRDDAQDALGVAQKVRDDAQEVVNGAQDDYNATQATLADRETHLSEQLAALNLASNAVTDAETDLNNAVDAKDNAQVNVGNAETTLSEAMDARRYTSLNGDTLTVNDPDSSNKTFQIGADNDINSQISFSMVNATAAGLSIDGTHLLDIDSARNSITSLDFSIDLTNSERSRLGSLQNRLQFTVSNLDNQTQNIEASRSNIADVDFAAEAMELTKNQILTQSATAMLAQASAISQNILSLIAA
jgi:flagellin